MDLGVLRDHIDDIDKQIIRLFEERMDVAEQVARYKIECGKQVYDPERERSKIERAKDMATTSFNARGVETLFNQLMAISRVRQYELIAESRQDNFGCFSGCRGRLRTSGDPWLFWQRCGLLPCKNL